MAKDTQRQIAQTMYIEQCATAKEIAAKLKVNEKTVSKWVKEGKWKELRLSKQTGPDNLVKNLNELLNTLLEKRLKYENKKVKTEQDDADHRSIIDEMSKLSAMIDRTQKDGRPSLRIHIFCLEKFMGALHQQKPKAFMELIPFQSEYLTLLADELK